jgi:hypothetical protein
MKEQILALESTDDLHSLRDKIARAQAGRLVLVWAALEEPLNRRLDVVLMKRWAAMVGSELAIVSPDEAVRRLARSAGVPCHASLTESALAALAPHPQLEGARSSPRIRKPRLPSPRSGRPRPLPPAVRIILFAAAVLSVAAVFLLLLPAARLTAVFPSRNVDAGGSFDSSWCSMLRSRLTLSDRRPTSGRALAPTAYAKGTVILINISNRVLAISAGLQVASESGITFETLEGLVLQAGKSGPAAVRAVEPGPSSNLPAGKVSRVLGPLSLSLNVENPAPLSGGQQGWRSVVTAWDWEALEKELSDRIRNEAESSLRALAGEGRMVVENSLQVELDPLDEPDLPVNSPADSLGLTLHAAASLLVCPADRIQSTALEILGSRLHPGETLSADSLTMRLSQNAAGGIDLAASGLAVEIPDRNAMSFALRGQTPDRAALILRERFHALAVPGIERTPGWFPLLPLFPYQIEILAEAE